MNRNSTTMLVALGVCCLAGCSRLIPFKSGGSEYQGASFLGPIGATGFPEGDLQKQWSQSIRQIGINPLFPIREDLQVGDVYVSTIQPDDENTAIRTRGHVNLDLWYAHLDLEKEINTFYKSRFLFEETTSYNKSGGYNDRSYLGDDFATPNDRRVARLVNFPAFASAKVGKNLSNKEILNFIPPEVMSFFWEDSRMAPQAISISASMAESYGLPVDIIHKKFDEQLKDSQVFAGLATSNTFQGIFQGDAFGREVKDTSAGYKRSVNYYMKLVTEVYMVRNLDIVFRINRDKQFVDGLHGGTLAGLDLNRLNQLLSQNIAASTSGGHVRFVSIGPDSVGLRRTFARPITVGYRGILLRVNAIDRTTTLVGPIDSKPLVL